MARTAKQILMAQGYTEAELANSPVLADARLVKSLEAEDAALEARINGFQSELTQKTELLTKTDKWYQETAVPTIEKTNRAAVEARARVAQLEAQLKAEADLGLRRVAEQEGAPPANTPPANTPPVAGEQVDPRYVTSDTFRQTADQFGNAIAMATDIQEDHRDLFGKRLPGGVEGLRNGYVKARSTGFQGSMRDYWAQEYKVNERRTELSVKEAADREAQIRADERAKVNSEMLNPNTRSPISSRNPFTNKKIEGGSVDGKQPWDTASREQRANARVMKFGTRVLNDVNKTA